jgi:hypothetical protein
MTTQAADGNNETSTLNIQGSIPTTGISILIPVTATASGTLPSYTTTVTIPAARTEDGISRDITLSWAQQGYTSATKTITATIAAVGGTLNVKKLDLNSGVGNDALGVLLGQFNYPINNTGTTSVFSLRATAGIPDRMFGVVDNSSSTTTHLMIYSPVMGEDGKIWLNNNLGAHYTNINHASFNPGQQATGSTDFRAYGSLFQWGRRPDGHELLNRTSATGTASVYSTTGTLADTPTHSSFITVPQVVPYDWRVNQSSTLWSSESSTNNPCPSGFRVPSPTEQSTLLTAAGISNIATAASSILKFSMAGHRYHLDATFVMVSTGGWYWSNAVSSTSGSEMDFTSSGASTNAPNVRGYGFSVRCIKN